MQVVEIEGSYRTYEEWKRSIQQIGNALTNSSYRTYEEWKHAPHWWSNDKGNSSYRTYEEWKLYCLRESSPAFSEFLPYL